MAIDWTADELVTAVREDARIPDGALTAAVILRFADRETKNLVEPWILKHREGLMSAYTDVAITSATAYRIPSRAFASGLRSVALIDTTGREVPLSQVPLEDLPRYTGPSSALSGYYIDGNRLRLVITDTTAFSGWYIRFRFIRRQSRLVPAASAAKIATGSGLTTSFTTAATIPATFSTSTPLDLIQAQPGFDWLATDVTPTTASGTSLIFASAPSTEVAALDYFALAGETPVVQIPPEARHILQQALLVRILLTLGKPNASGEQAKLNEAMQAQEALWSGRVQSGGKRVVNRNSFATGGGRSRWVR